VRRLHSAGFNQLDAIRFGLMNVGWMLEPGDKVLDFGCGPGTLVYQFRDEGFDAYGFDLFDTVALRDAADRQFFSHLIDPRINPADTTLGDDEVKLPYADGSFDVVVSMTVIEHCYALDGMMRECARVLKPDGVSIHLYPSRNQVLEPHFLVPFGGVIQSDYWLRLWAWLGIRNSGQKDMSAKTAAEHNRFYLDSGLSYRSNRVVASITNRYFNQVKFVDRAYYPRHSLQTRLREMVKAARSDSALEKLAEQIKCRVLLATRPKQ
jgi:SAM-dependent methyltransferase